MPCGLLLAVQALPLGDVAEPLVRGLNFCFRKTGSGTPESAPKLGARASGSDYNLVFVRAPQWGYSSRTGMPPFHSCLRLTLSEPLLCARSSAESHQWRGEQNTVPAF